MTIFIVFKIFLSGHTEIIFHLHLNVKCLFLHDKPTQEFL